jgi:hypothetical protein
VARHQAVKPARVRKIDCRISESRSFFGETICGSTAPNLNFSKPLPTGEKIEEIGEKFGGKFGPVAPPWLSGLYFFFDVLRFFRCIVL